MISTILFDVDGVLLDSFEANLKYFRDIATRAGIRVLTRDEYKKLFHKSIPDIIAILTNGSEEEAKKVYKIAASNEVSYDTSLITPPKELEMVLESLSKKYKLGVVTSRPREDIFEGLHNELAHLKNYFAVTIGYEDTKNHKPHPEPLLLATEKLGVKPEECVYVGDAESDMTAAQAAEMKFIQYSPTPSPEATLNTYDFVEIPKLIVSI